MFRNIAIGLAIAGYSCAQDDTTTPTVPDTDPRPSSIDLDTTPTVLPTVTLTDNVITGSVSTRAVVTAACVPESEQPVSIQTDTVVPTGPLTITPVCGQSVSPSGTDSGSLTTGDVIITGGGGNASAITTSITTNGTVLLTTSVSGMESGVTTMTATTGSETTTTAGGGSGSGVSASSGAAATQTDSAAGRVAVGKAAAGVLGVAAGVIMW